MMSTLSNRLPRRERLSGRSAIRAAFRSRRVSCRGMGLFYKANVLGLNRVLVTTRKGYGNAVARNRARRTGREFYRKHRAAMAVGYDLAFVFHPGDFPSADRYEQMAHVLRSASLLREGAAKDTVSQI